MLTLWFLLIFIYVYILIINIFIIIYIIKYKYIKLILSFKNKAIYIDVSIVEIVEKWYISKINHALVLTIRLRPISIYMTKKNI